MGDRANILVKDDDKDGGVYLYSHWAGSQIPDRLRAALSKKWRWTDSAYLTRIIFDVMTDGQQGYETGYGISSLLGDGDNRILTVNCHDQTVSFADRTWTFEEYISLSDDEIENVWSG